MSMSIIKTKEFFLHKDNMPVCVKLVYQSSTNESKYGYKRGYFMECSRERIITGRHCLLEVSTRKTAKNLEEAEKLFDETINDYMKKYVLPHVRTYWPYNLRRNYMLKKEK